jgi:hypothetical protein
MESITRHPRFITAAYSVCLGVSCCLLALFFFYTLGLGEMLPSLNSVLLSIPIAACFGAFYGPKMLENRTVKSSFLLGVIFLVTVLPVYDIGALFLIQSQFQGTETLQHCLTDYLILYGMIVVYSFIFVGSWLSILCGFASICLNKVLLKNTAS